MALSVDGLKVYYQSLRGDVKAVDGATFSIADGEIMGLAGESGCGKSTLGKSLIRMDARMRYVSGQVELDGVELPIWDDAKMNSFRFAKVSIIPQYALSALNPTRKIGRMRLCMFWPKPASYRTNRHFSVTRTIMTNDDADRAGTAASVKPNKADGAWRLMD